MLESHPYAQILRPAGILRIITIILILISAAGLWHAPDLSAWLTNTLPLLLWSVFSLSTWLLLLSFSAGVWFLMHRAHQSRQAALWPYQLWAVLLGTLCTCTFSNLTEVSTADFPALWPVRFDLGAAAWGAIISTGIIKWFDWYSRGQKPANTEAKLMELQARIRPHFLFNTLNSAISLVRLDPQAAETILLNLSQLFRAALESGQNSNELLQQEVDLAKSYLFIESFRLGKRLNVRWQLDPRTLEVKIPILSLQPIIENAVKHGIEPVTGNGHIIIKSTKSMGKAIVTVLNTIPNLDEQTPTIMASHKGHGIALENLKMRLTLLHDFEGSLKTKIFTEKNGQSWFITRIEVPAT